MSLAQEKHMTARKRYQRPSLQRREKLAKVTEQELPVTGRPIA